MQFQLANALSQEQASALSAGYGNTSDMNMIDPAKKTATTFVLSRPDLFRAEFLEWLENNFSVWLAFKKQADRIWLKGRRHYSARTILHWLRHETMVREETTEEFKINNIWSPYLGRLYVCYHPERSEFFKRRALKAAA